MLAGGSFVVIYHNKRQDAVYEQHPHLLDSMICYLMNGVF